jgi:hypothetical protein
LLLHEEKQKSCAQIQSVDDHQSAVTERRKQKLALNFSVDKSFFQTKMQLQRQSLRRLVNKTGKLAKIRVW